MRVIAQIVRMRFTQTVATISSILFVGPLVFYAWSRATGALPSREAWWAQATNHGPWRWTLPGLFVAMPFIFLIPLTLISAVAVGAYRRDARYVGAGALLLVLQCGFLWGHFAWLFWTVD